MQRAILPLLSVSAFLVACEPDAATTAPDVATSETAGTDEAASDEEDNAAQSEEEAKAARLAKRFEELEAKKAEDAKRWTDEMKAEAKKLVDADHKDAGTAIAAILAGGHRHPDNVARDGHRHPAETLAFFGIKQDMTVVEVGPGAGWYSEILAPLLAKKGKHVVNNGDANGPETEGGTFYARRFQYFLDQNADLYGKVVQEHPKDGELNLGAADSADAVLIIRGLHGHARRGTLDKTLDTVHSTLKTGGILGVVQHRAAEGADVKESAPAGYVPQAWLVEQIEAKGFKLEESSELNANPKDTRDHAEGVWTLPPTLALGDEDADKYKAIGESDRMTLRFVKK
jgi:predicted methyltransferase